MTKLQCLERILLQWHSYPLSCPPSTRAWQIDWSWRVKTASLNCCHKLTYCSSPRWYMSMENDGGMILTGENKITWDKNLSQCHFLHHKSNVDWPGNQSVLSKHNIKTTGSNQGISSFFQPVKDDTALKLGTWCIQCPLHMWDSIQTRCSIKTKAKSTTIISGFINHRNPLWQKRA
jgi:hypothetical protein